MITLHKKLLNHLIPPLCSLESHNGAGYNMNTLLSASQVSMQPKHYEKVI